jgi:hypothetical protein
MNLKEAVAQWNFTYTAYFGILFSEFAEWNSLTKPEQDEWRSLCDLADSGLKNIGNMTIDELQESVTETLKRSRKLLYGIRDRIIAGLANGTLKPDDVKQQPRSPISFSMN